MEAEQKPSPAALHARAIVDLVIGSAEGIDRAVARLEDLTAAYPDGAEAWNDLAAAYLLRARRREEPRDLVRALSAVERALEEDPGLAEALFNRGLICEALSLPAAGEVWREYLRRSPEPGWQEEAQERLRAREGNPTRAAASDPSLSPQAAREHAEVELLGDWAEAYGRSSGKAARSLDLAREVGVTLAAGGERLVQDAVAAIDSASRERDEERLSALQQGHQAYRTGFDLSKRGEWSAAEKLFAAAERALARAGSPFADRAAFYRAVCTYHRSSGESSALLERLERAALSDRPCQALLGHVEWLQGVIHGDRDEALAAIRCFERSLACFERLGETGNVAAVRGLLAGILHDIGRRREAWIYRYQSLHAAEALTDPVRRYMVYAPAADTALAEGQLAAALRFQDEAVRQAEAATNPGALADALFWRGLMRNRAGRRQEAWVDLRLARQKIERLPDPAARRRLEADISWIEGEISLADDPHRAVDLLTSSLHFYEALGHNFLAVLIYRLRARAHHRIGDLDRAEADLRAALAAYERLGESLSREQQRLAFVADTEEAFDEMIAFQVLARRRPEAAFHFADHARTRVLPVHTARTRAEGMGQAARERLLASEPRPLDPGEIRRRLPAATSLVQFAVLPDRLLIWRVRREGVLLIEQPVSRTDLERRVNRLRVSRRRTQGAEAWNRESSALFASLVRPWLAGTAHGETIVFVPDKVLHSVPFAALRNPDTGRYLVQDYRIAGAPSATLYLTSGRWRATPSRERLPALVVSNPAFDRSRWSGLAPLPASDVEAETITRQMSAVLIRGEEATRDSFLELARRSSMIHFAGHAVADPRDPLRSLLVLAPSDRGEIGALYAWELYQTDLASTRLVVLSACRTAADSPAADEGTTNLARAFLAAGASQVVASLWEVDDRATARFFAAFYRSLLAQPDPVGALRDAQLSFLSDPEEPHRAPWVWGAFEVVATGANPCDQIDRRASSCLSIFE